MRGPKLNSCVWIRFDCGGSTSLTKCKVIAKGTDIFIHSGVINDDYVNDFRKPIKYSDIDITWFNNLTQARKVLGKLKKIEDDYYEVIY